MGYYKILSEPMQTCMPHYKGLYRSEPFPQSNDEDRFLSLWQRYVQHKLNSMGVTTELTLDELKEFANLATKATGDCYEVIFISETLECPYLAEYYGVDVAGLGGYSMVGENFFTESREFSNGIYHLHDLISQHFRTKLNTNGLFSSQEDAISFLTILNDLTELSPGCVEQEAWNVIHIFKVK